MEEAYEDEAYEEKVDVDEEAYKEEEGRSTRRRRRTLMSTI